MIRALMLLIAMGLSGPILIAQTSVKPTLVEKIEFDWDHSGSPAQFSLYFQNRSDSLGDADQLTIRSKGHQPWTLANKDDAWGPAVVDDIPKSKRENLVKSKRLFFVRAGHTAEARIYLVLKGAGYGCCVGSSTVLTPDRDGMPKIVFHDSEHLLQDIYPLPDESGLVLVGQPSDDEARATKNAASYDPYRVYILNSDQPAIYDLKQSKEYTIAHYCEWAGPKYNEKFVAVNVDSEQYGVGHCKTMTEAQFDDYYEKHKSHFE
jgi:hypothetical protein